MNHAQVMDHEANMLKKFKSEGKKLAHICMDWDGLAIHADMDEISACCCDFDLEIDNALRDTRADEVSRKMELRELAGEKPESKVFSKSGAPAHSGTMVEPTKEELVAGLRKSVEYMAFKRTSSGEPAPLYECEGLLARWDANHDQK